MTPTNPHNSAKTSAVQKLATLIPGTIYGRAKKASALTNHLNKSIKNQLTNNSQQLTNLIIPVYHPGQILPAYFDGVNKNNHDVLLMTIVLAVITATAQKGARGLETDDDIKPQ